MAAAVQIIQSAAAAEKLLKPERLKMLQHLADEPGSATTLAKVLQMPRQTVNYHLRELEKEGFVELFEERVNRNCVERRMRATARSYVISPIALGALGIDAGSLRDRFSSSYLVSAAARAIRDVATLRHRADKAGKKIATLTLETEVRFASAQTRQQFAEELVNAVAKLAAKYHDEKAEGGRSFRFLMAGFPVLSKPDVTTDDAVRME